MRMAGIFMQGGSSRWAMTCLIWKSVGSGFFWWYIFVPTHPTSCHGNFALSGWLSKQRLGSRSRLLDPSWSSSRYPIGCVTVSGIEHDKLNRLHTIFCQNILLPTHSLMFILLFLRLEGNLFWNHFIEQKIVVWTFLKPCCQILKHDSQRIPQ